MVLLIYWVISFGLECGTLVKLVQSDLDDPIVLRYDLVLALVVVYGVLFCAEVYHLVHFTGITVRKRVISGAFMVDLATQTPCLVEISSLSPAGPF